MRKPLGHKGEVGVLEELSVLVSVQVEAPGDGNVGSDDLPKAPRDLGFGSRDVAHCHGSVEGEIDPVHR